MAESCAPESSKKLAGKHLSHPENQKKQTVLPAWPTPLIGK